MIVKTLLYIEGAENPDEVLDSSWSIEKPVSRGLEQGMAVCGTLNVVLKNVETIQLYSEWAKTVNSRKNGRLEFLAAETGEPVKATIEFENALCSLFRIEYHKYDKEGMALSLSLESESMDLV